MVKNILVSTTSTLEGWEIKKYFKPVSAHLVVGTNLFSDVLADFSDIFGGRSNTYQRKIATLYKDAIKQLEIAAYELGANCIVGLSVDLDEISGKGKSMFMLTATGTAVLAKRVEKQLGDSKTDEYLENVSADTIERLMRKKKLIASAKSGQLELSDAEWTFINENRIHEVLGFLFSRFESLAVGGVDPGAIERFYQKLVEYIGVLPDEHRVKFLYDELVSDKHERVITAIRKIVKELQLVDYELIKEYLNSDDFNQNKRILYVVVFNKPFYNGEDIKILGEIKNIIEQKFNERGERGMKKQMFSSKEKEVWTCECGKQNAIEDHCSGCGLDIYGFKANEVKPRIVKDHLDYKMELINECLAGSKN